MTRWVFSFTIQVTFRDGTVIKLKELSAKSAELSMVIWLLCSQLAVAQEQSTSLLVPQWNRVPANQAALPMQVPQSNVAIGPNGAQIASPVLQQPSVPHAMAPATTAYPPAFPPTYSPGLQAAPPATIPDPGQALGGNAATANSQGYASGMVTPAAAAALTPSGSMPHAAGNSVETVNPYAGASVPSNPYSATANGYGNANPYGNAQVNAYGGGQVSANRNAHFQRELLGQPQAGTIAAVNAVGPTTGLNAYGGQAAGAYVNIPAPTGPAQPATGVMAGGGGMANPSYAPAGGGLWANALQSSISTGNSQWPSTAGEPAMPNRNGYSEEFSDWSGGSCNPPVAAPCCETPRCNSSPCGDLCGGKCAPQWWLRMDVLLGFISGYDTPVLVARNPAGTPIEMVGDLSAPSTEAIYGGDKFGEGLRVGGMVQMGFWFDECRKWGFQNEFFSLGNSDDDRRIDGNDGDILSRPFYNTGLYNGAPDAQVFQLYGVAEGSFSGDTSSRIMSAAPAFRYNLNCCSSPCSDVASRWDLLAGYRYLRFQEKFQSLETLVPQDYSYVNGTSFALRDRIETTNEFNGFEFGAAWMRQSRRWTTSLTGLLACGRVNRKVDLFGSTRTIVPGVYDTVIPGGFLVQPENIGTYRQQRSAVIPQFRADIGYCLCKNVRFNVGYRYLYLDDVFRPGDFMNTSFDGSTLGIAPTLVGSEQPDLKGSSVSMHAISLGLSYNF